MEIYYKQISDKEGVVRFFYEKENDTFFRDIHKRKGTCEQCIQDTLQSTSDESVLYGVYNGDNLIAYFVKYDSERGQSLEGFHVSKEYRNQPFLTLFWEMVKSAFEKTIYTGIYVRNEPAIKSLLKAGFEFNNFTEHNKQLFLILKR